MLLLSSHSIGISVTWSSGYQSKWLLAYVALWLLFCQSIYWSFRPKASILRGWGFRPPDFGMGVVRIAGGCGRVSKYHYSLFLYRKHVIFHRKYIGKWLISRNREKSKNIRLKSEIFFDRIHDPRFHARLTPLRQITGLRSHIATQTRSLATRCLTDH